MYSKSYFLHLINEAADGYPSLANLQRNPSRVSAWGYVKEVMAFALSLLARMFEAHRQEVEQQLASQRIGSRSWYVAQAKAFQYGDRLGMIDDRPGYETVNTSKRMVKQASVVEKANGRLCFKVAGADDSGELKVLKQAELDALGVYMDQIKLAGTPIELISAPADVVKLTMFIERDKQRMDRLGRDLLDVRREPVYEALVKYLKALPFDSVFYLSKLQDAIQNVDGVVDVSITQVTYQHEQQATPRPLLRKYTSYAGYIRLDPTSVITYSP